MSRSLNLLSALAIGTLPLGACNESQSMLPTTPSVALAKAEFPPDAWVFYPAPLPPGFGEERGLLRPRANTSTTLGPHVACQSKQWGKSGIYREQARDLVAIGPVAQDLCGGPA